MKILGPSCTGLLGLLLFSACSHHSWENYLGQHKVEADRIRPGDALEVLEAVRRAHARGRRIRAVGSGHSSSDVARPAEEGLYIDASAMGEINRSWGFYRDLDAERFVRVGAWATIKAINQALAKMDPPRALYNMGNYDAQTIAGAFSTGTHGSGLRHGPLQDRIVAIEIVTGEAGLKGEFRPRLLRLEPADGPTDPARFEREHSASEDAEIRAMALLQDDLAFRAVLLGLGSFGIITSVTVDTREGFWLLEQESLGAWSKSSPPDLTRLGKKHREFLQLNLAPHKISEGERKGQVIYQQIARREVPACEAMAARRPLVDQVPKLVAFVAKTWGLQKVQLEAKKLAERIVLGTFDRRARDPHFKSRSDLVLVTSLGGYVKATSIDIQVPLDTAVAAVQRIIDLAEDRGDGHEHIWWHTSPIGVRFVGPSKALIAPTSDGPRVSIEVPLLRPGGHGSPDDRGAWQEKMLRDLERELTGPDYRGRPHWGQRNWLTGPRALAMYGNAWSCWVQQLRRFNALGVFDNAFTDRMCISKNPPPACQGVRATGVCDPNALNPL